MDSSHVFDLRKEAKELSGDQKLNKLNEAHGLAKRLNIEDPYDDWIIRAFAWTLIDLCKYYVSTQNVTQATNYFNQLHSFFSEYRDDYIEKQISYLRPRIDVNYSEIQRAEDLSKNKNHLEAISIFKKQISENRLSEKHHESYGWVIYRYIKDEENNLSSIQIKTFLKDYMSLKNGRPSLLHSMILTFALHYSKGHSDFNLYNFFKLWGPVNLRDDDKSKQFYNDNEIPSLISRIFRAFIENRNNIDIEYLAENVEIDSLNENKTNEQQVLDLLREPCFWQIYNVNKENKHLDLWNLFENYTIRFSKFGKSKWHSEVLSLAERYMQEKDEWRFLEFFKQWDPSNFMDEDWEEVKQDENTFKPLSIKCLKKAYEVLKNREIGNNKIDWLIDTYDKAILKFPKDDWVKREKALLLIRNKTFDEPIQIYKSLVFNLGDKAYIWHEFSACFPENIDLKIGMLLKAVQLEKNEDFLGDIHLELAKALIDNNLVENAIVELSSYQKHREEKGWKLSETYHNLLENTKNFSTSLKDNKELYSKYIPFAENFAYQEIEWADFVLIDIWKDEKQKERCSFSNGRGINFSVGTKRFTNLGGATIGNVFEFKLHKKKKEIERNDDYLLLMTKPYEPHFDYTYIPLLLKKSTKEDWSILEDEYAIIDYINIDKNVIHAITSKNEEIYFKCDSKKYNVNDFIKGKRIKIEVKNEARIELKNLVGIDKSIGIDKFGKEIAVVDHVNQEKKLFHFVVDRTIQGIVRYNETKIRPDEGSFVEIWLARKTDKKRNKIIYKPLEIKETNEINDKLKKRFHGFLILKYKTDRYTKVFCESDDDDDNLDDIKPDYGFISDFYVPKYLLEKNEITKNCIVSATAIFSGDKWKVIELEKE